jgi:hypothetical protein
MNTPTAAFTAIVPGIGGSPPGVCRPAGASGLPDLWRLDNPILDDSPGAMVFVQRLFRPGDTNFSQDQAEVAYYLPDTSGGCQGSRWYLEARGTAEGVSRRVAVLVVKP